jgi:hypothetical protein
VIGPDEPWGETVKLKLGQLAITLAALQVLTRRDIRIALVSHMVGDWGEVCEEDRRANDQALIEGGRLVAVYRSSTGIKFYAITEADRSYTTVLLPEDY